VMSALITAAMSTYLSFIRKGSILAERRATLGLRLISFKFSASPELHTAVITT